MTKQIDTTNAPKAQWEAPEVVGLDMDLVDVKSLFAAGTDGLLPGGTQSDS